MPIRHDVYNNSSCQLFPQMKPKQKNKNKIIAGQHSSSPSFVVVWALSPPPHSRFIFTRFSFLIRHETSSEFFFFVNSWEREEAYLMALITFQLALQQLTTTNSLMTLGICRKQKIISFVPVFSMETKPRSLEWSFNVLDCWKQAQPFVGYNRRCLGCLLLEMRKNFHVYKFQLLFLNLIPMSVENGHEPNGPVSLVSFFSHLAFFLPTTTTDYSFFFRCLLLYRDYSHQVGSERPAGSLEPHHQSLANQSPQSFLVFNFCVLFCIFAVVSTRAKIKNSSQHDGLVPP